jgi:hypothetical protein
MALPDLTGQNIENTYQRIVQTDGTNFYDGTGSLVILPSANTSSLVTTSSFNAFTSSINQFTSSYNTGSFTGSFTGNFNGTATTASYYQEVDPVFVAKSASLATTGSNIFIGNQTVTGSLFTTGSNTLVGNTILSGTLQIQGEYPPSAGSASVSIIGNVDLNGYLRFDPVSSNINTSLSASYIYVSGSTNDLYFSQNGSGYNNVTRLRWLEANLYTGLLHGGALTQVNSNTYQVASGSGIIVNLNASIPNDPYPTIQFLNWGNLTKTIDALSASFDQQFIAISSSGQIYAQGTPFFNGQVDRYIPVGIVLHQNHTSINGTKTQPSLGYGWKQRSNVFISAFGPLKLSGHSIATSSSLGLTVGSGTSFADGANYPIDPNNPSYVNDPGTNVSKIFRYWQSGSDWVYDTNNGAGYTTIDPTLYASQSAGGATLTTVPGGGSNRQYSIQRVFWYPNSVSKAIVVYYGNATYITQTDAVANIAFEPFTEAPNTAANAIYLGALVVRNNADFTVAASYKIERGGLFRGVGGGGGGGGTTSPGGSNTQIQYNNNGAFGGVPNLTWNGTTLLATGSFTGSFTGSLLGTSSYSTTASYASNGGVTRILAGPNITLSPTNGLGQVTITSTGGGGGTGNTTTGSYGSFYDTTTQTNPVINVIHSMSLNTTDISNGVSISGSTSPYNTYIKIENAGVYDIQFSAQLEKTSPGGTNITYIWLRKNGIDLAETNTAFELSQNGKGVAAWNWFVNSATNDYYQIMWSSNANDTQLTAETPTVGPTVPSVIVTTNRVDQFLSNTGSFTGSFTGNLIGTASTASFYQETDPVFVAKSASLATTGSNNFNGNQTITGSLLQGLEGNIATGEYSHAEGSITKAIGNYSHAEGDFTQAKGDYSHAEGQETIASGSYSHAEGYQTIALANHQHVQGQWNTTSLVQSAFIVGNGTDDSNRSNLIYAHNSTVEITGSLEVNGGITGSLFGTSTTSSYTPNAIVTASATPGNYTMRLTKGDGSYFDVTLTTPAPTPFPTTDTGSFFKNAVLGGDLYGNDKIVFTRGDNSTLLLSLTSSYVLINQTSSMTVSSSLFASTASFLSVGTYNITASWAQSASNAVNARTASFVNNLNQNLSITGAVVLSGSSLPELRVIGETQFTGSVNSLNGFTGSLFGTSSQALTASFTPNAIVTASVNSNVITFTKGSGTTFTITVNTGSGGGGGGVTINSNVNDYIVTATGTANTLNGESNLTFDGSKLTVTGKINQSAGGNSSVVIGVDAGTYTYSNGYGDVIIGPYSDTVFSYSGNAVAIGATAIVGESGVAIGPSSKNTEYGVSIGDNAGNGSTGGYNVFIGRNAGRSNTGTYNVFIGNDAGNGAAGSNKLYIDNSNTSSPLIYGEFDTNLVRVNGRLQVTSSCDITGSLTLRSDLTMATTSSTIPAGSAPEGTIRLFNSASVYRIYVYLNGGWRSSSLA